MFESKLFKQSRALAFKRWFIARCVSARPLNCDSPMGNNCSVEQCRCEAQKVKDLICNKCNSYMMSVEHTNASVDVELKALQKEIMGLISPLRTMPKVIDLGMLGMSALIEDVEQYANYHKHAIRTLFDTLYQAQSEFESIAEKHISDENVSVECVDDEAMHEIRCLIEKLLQNYNTELQTVELADDILRTRSHQLHILLFKLAESTIAEAVETIVTECKCSTLDDIDNTLTAAISNGDITTPEYAQATLQAIIMASLAARDALEELPFSRRMDIENAQDEIEMAVGQLIRNVQMSFADDTDSLKLVMSLNPLYDAEDDDSDELVVTGTALPIAEPEGHSDESENESEPEDEVPVKETKKRSRKTAAPADKSPKKRKTTKKETKPRAPPSSEKKPRKGMTTRRSKKQ